MLTRSFVFALTLVALVLGCDNNPRRTVVITAPPQRQVTVTQAAPQPPAVTTLMDSSDLDLATIADLLRSGRVQDADTLQATINNPTNALNNVDLDKDGNIDPITVTEVPSANGKTFNLVANPATQPAVTVATIDVTLTNGQVLVQAGYPAYVNGYQSNFYSYQAASNLAFLAWALAPRPLYVARPYSSYSWYAPSQHVYAPDTVTQRRTTYTTQTHVSPVQKSVPPPTFTQQAQATKVPSGFTPSAAARPAPTTNNLNDRATATDFKERDPSKPVAQATGFGAKATPDAPKPSPPSPSPSPVTQSAFAGTTSPPPKTVAPPAPPSPSPTTASFQNSRPSAPRVSSSPPSPPPSPPKATFQSSRPSAPRVSSTRR